MRRDSESESLIAELLLQHAILFEQVIDDLSLMVLGPAIEAGEEELKGDEFGGQARIIV